MDARTYLDTYGDDRCRSVAIAAGTTLGYYKQIAYRHRRPSVDLAQRLVQSSNGELDFISLLAPPTPPPKGQDGSGDGAAR